MGLGGRPRTQANETTFETSRTCRPAGSSTKWRRSQSTTPPARRVGPKGVQYAYRGAYSKALNEVIVAGMGTDSVYLWTLPMFHCNGWCFPWAAAEVAARHATMRGGPLARVGAH